WIEGMVAWRGRALGMPYGDQGLLIKRSFYDRVGGYRPLPLMEDVDLVRRIGRRRLVALDVDAVTSAARYERDGWTLRPMRNLLCLSLFLLGVAPARIARLYGR
ncbi:MAG: glycosyl transferase family 2, partial [Rhodospirillales bacterium]|nr:glycosyl transferase family 2 [Rhodospirillales bacterium]